MTSTPHGSTPFMPVRQRRRKAWIFFVLAGLLAALSVRADPTPDDTDDSSYLSWDDSMTNGLGSWIWASNTFDRQTCQFWRSFDLPASTPVQHAELRMTADNEYTLYLDGRELGRGAEWRELFDYNLTALLTPGRHVFGVVAYNSSSYAGLLFGLKVDLADGSSLALKSDSSWRIVPNDNHAWLKALEASPNWGASKVVRPLGSLPWWTVPQNVNVMPTLEPVKTHFWQTAWFQISLLSVCVVTALISLRLLAQLAAHRKERWLLQQERARIARDIHDDLGSRMTQLVLHGEVAQSELPPDSSTRAQIDRICEEARGVLSTMDEILWAVNPRRDTFRDFASYVCDYAQEYLKATPIRCLFDIDPEIAAVALDLPVRRALLMIIKESLNNSVKHSGATELVLEMRWRAPRLEIVVADNGRGFEVAKAGSERHGLGNMQERMKEVGGYCLLTSQPGKGCRVEFGVSIKQPRWSGRNWLAKGGGVSDPLVQRQAVLE